MNNYHSRQREHGRQHSEARKLAQVGLLVGPLKGKAPLSAAIPGGLYDFTSDLTVIDYWWDNFGSPNVGARPPKGYIIIDVDTDHGGVEKWQEFNEGHDLPKTISTKTGSDGYHFWFRLPYTGELRGRLAPGVDVRHDKNYVVMPGSIHPETRKEYERTGWVDLADVPMLPTHLRRLTYKPVSPIPSHVPHRQKYMGDGEHLVRMVQEAVSGSRNETLNTAAFLAAKNDYDIFDDLASAADSIGLELNEIEATIRSGKIAGEKEVNH